MSVVQWDIIQNKMLAGHTRDGQNILTIQSEGMSCIKTKHWSAKTAAKNSSSQPANRNFTHPEVSRTSPRDVKLAVTQERTQTSHKESFSQLPALTAARKLKFLSSPVTTDQFIAAIVSQQ
jgi:hypothetical protein